MGNLSGESREQNRKAKVTRFRSVMYARQLGLLVNTLESHLKLRVHLIRLITSQFWFALFFSLTCVVRDCAHMVGGSS